MIIITVYWPSNKKGHLPYISMHGCLRWKLTKDLENIGFTEAWVKKRGWTDDSVQHRKGNQRRTWKRLDIMALMMMNCFCSMVGQQKALKFIFRPEHCQRFLPLWIPDKPGAQFEPAQNLSSGFVECSCAVVITTTSWHHYTTGLQFNVWSLLT